MPWWRTWRHKFSAHLRAGTHTPRHFIGPKTADAFFYQKPTVVMGPSVPIVRGGAASRAKTLRRAGSRRAAAARPLHHGGPALIGALGAEPEQTVDAGEA